MYLSYTKKVLAFFSIAVLIFVLSSTTTYAFSFKNFFSFGKKVAQEIKADLTVASIGIDTKDGLDPQEGKMYGGFKKSNLFITLKNIGFVDAENFEFTFNILDGEGNILATDKDGFAGGFGTKKIEKIRAGESFTLGFPIVDTEGSTKMPNQIPPKARFIQVTVDSSNSILELDEKNNVLDFTLPLPDVVVTEPNISDKDSILVEFQNKGDAETGKIYYEIQWLGPNQKYMSTFEKSSSMYIDSIKPGSKFQLNSLPTLDSSGNNLIPIGAKYAKLVADPHYKIVEKDKTNNEFTIILPGIDLKVESISLGSEYTYDDISPEYKKDNYVIIRVINLGTKDVQGVQFSYDTYDKIGNTIGSGTDYLPMSSDVSSYKAGETKTIAINTDNSSDNLFTEDDIYIEFFIDKNNFINEIDKTNNSSIFLFKTADISIKSVDFNEVGSPVVVVENLGNISCTEDFSVGLEWRDKKEKYIGSFQMYAQGDEHNVKSCLKKGESKTVKFSNEVLPPKNAAYVDVIADSTGQILENNKENNEIRVSLDLPDLTIKSIKFGSEETSDLVPSNYKNDNYLIVTAINQSNKIIEDVSFEFGFFDPNYFIKHLDNSHIISQTDISKFNPGELKNIFINLADDNTQSIIPKNTLSFGVAIDNKEKITESNEKNNLMTIDWLLPDLAIDSISFSKTGGPMIVVQNKGKIKSPSFSLGYRWLDKDLNNLKGFNNNPLQDLLNNVDPLDSGKMAIMGFPLDVPPENALYLRIFVDYQKELFESDEFNNEITILVSPEKLTGVEIAQAEEKLVIAGIQKNIKQDFEEQNNENPEGKKADTLFDPTILPGNPLYILKLVNRSIRSTITRDPIKKAELKIKYANIKIIEAYKLKQKGKKDKAIKHLKSYEKELEKITESIDNIQQRDAKRADSLIDKVIKNLVRHQAVLSGLEKDTTGETLEKVKESREKTFQEIGKFLEKTTTQRKRKEIIKKATDEEGSQYKDIRNLEILRLLEENISEDTREFVIDVKNETIKRFRSRFEKISEESKNKLSDYVDESTGNEIIVTKVFEDIKKIDESTGADKQIDQAKKRLFKRLENRVIQAKSEGEDDTSILLKGLEKNTAENTKLRREISEGNVEEIKKFIKRIDKVIEQKNEEVSCTEDIWKCDNWSTCDDLNNQYRSCFKDYDCPNTDTLKPETKKVCETEPIIGETKKLQRELITCTEDIWKCDNWSTCDDLNNQYRSCFKDYDCPTVDTPKPNQTQICSPTTQQKEIDSPTQPVIKCTEDIWTCSKWDECLGETQLRTCNLTFDCPEINSPKPDQKKLCTPTCTKDDWFCSPWDECSVHGGQKRTCTQTYDCPNADTPKPNETQLCTFEQCSEDTWTCSTWNDCTIDGVQQRTCTQTYDCPNADTPKPNETQVCTPKCTEDAWKCSDWSTCSPTNGTQTRNCFLDNDCPLVNTPKPAETKTCRIRPDLIVQSLELHYTSYKLIEGEDLTFYAIIKNQGQLDAGIKTTAYLYIDDKLRMGTITNPIKSDTTQVVQFTEIWNEETGKAGQHTYKICTDGKEEILESREDNNCNSHRYTILPKQ